MSFLGAISEFLRTSEFISIISAIAGGITAILIRTIGRRITSRRIRSMTEEREFTAALASDHLPTLGTYLRKQLGEVRLGAYLGDPVAQSRVNKYLKRLEQFVKVADVGEPNTEYAGAPSQPFGALPLSKNPGDPPAVLAAVDRIQNGETWTALAGLRRDIERHIAQKFSSGDVRKLPVHMYVQDPSLKFVVRHFWNLASRAIHGEDVSEEEAATAVNLAREIYVSLQRLPQQS